MRVECFNPARRCCEVVMVQSEGVAARSQQKRMGVYVREREWNGRLAYKHTDWEEYIFYYDWGPNSGANWMFTNQIGSTERGMESVNVEFANQTECLAETELQGRQRVWMVWAGDDGWEEDSLLRILCL